MIRKINTYKITFLIIITILITSFFSFQKKTCLAGEENPSLGTKLLKGLYDTGENSGYSAQNINQDTLIVSIAKIAQIILSLLGIIFLVLIIYSGFQWMTSGGNEEKITTAKKKIINSTIGLTIIILSYTISYFIMQIIYDSNIA